MMVYGGQDRRPIGLGPDLARGGQGIIYSLLADENLLAKIYFQADPADGDRLLWMVHNPPPGLKQSAAHANVAWPQIPLYDAPHGGRFVGYVMPRVRDSVLLLDLITPKVRARKLPKFDWKYLHRTAGNLAHAVGVVHHSDYVVGDLNESNVLVTPGALVTLIDVDSFQTIEQRGDLRIIHPCPVGKPEYTAPELQGAELSHVRRTNEHDAFALAVLVFQLLLAGRHPFQSIWKGAGDAPTIADKIHRGLFPYAETNRARVAPPPNSTLSVLHPALQGLIVRCFVDGQSDPLRRPTPDEWATALAEAEGGLIHCAYGHSYSSHLGYCPECNAERLRQQRLRQHTQSVRHPAPAAHAGAGHAPAGAPVRTVSANRPPAPVSVLLLRVGTVLAVVFIVANFALAIYNNVAAWSFVPTPVTGVAALAATPPPTLSPAAPGVLPATVIPIATVTATATATDTATDTATPTVTASLPPPTARPSSTTLPLATANLTPLPGSPRLHTIAQTSLRLGPALSFPAWQVLESGTEIIPIGRTRDGVWLYVFVTQNTERGWVEADKVVILGGLNSIPIQEFLSATPTP